MTKNRGYGSILGEDARVIYFDEKALAVGDWVEYEEQYWRERVRAVKVPGLLPARAWEAALAGPE